MAKARRRNRRRLKSYGAPNKIRRQRYSRRSQYILVRIRADFSSFQQGIERARTALQNWAPAETRIQEVLDYSELGEVIPDVRNYLENALGPILDEARQSWQELTGGVAARIQPMWDTRDDSESEQIMRDVESHQTLEEKGILPTLDESMRRWQELIDEVRDSEEA